MPLSNACETCASYLFTFGAGYPASGASRSAQRAAQMPRISSNTLGTNSTFPRKHSHTYTPHTAITIVRPRALSSSSPLDTYHCFYIFFYFLEMRVLAVATLALAVASTGYAAHLPRNNRRFATSSESSDISAKLDAFEAKYAAHMRERGVPGMFFGLATADNIIRTGGIGVLDVTKPNVKVNGDTLFGIGSTTKAMTAALLGTLIADGKVGSVYDPIRKYYPFFELKDSYASEHCAFEDAMSHRTGLPRYDILEYVDRYGDPDNIAKRLKYLEPTNAFRTKYEYNNLMWDVIGHASVHVINSHSGSHRNATYESAMQERVFKPIGMNRTTTLTDTALKNGNLAAPHYRASPGVAKVVQHEDIGIGGPSGSVYTSANDATRYLQTLLHHGVSPAGKRVLASDFVDELIKPRMVVKASTGGKMADSDKEFNIEMYALGWRVENFRGRRLVSHGGAVVGFSTYFAWLPEHGVAAVASVNSELDFTGEAAVYDLLDIFFGEDNRGKDWLKLTNRDMPPYQLPHPVPNTQPSHSNYGDYAGVYVHPAFGEARITFNKSSKSLNLSTFGRQVTCTLAHYHYDTFSCRYNALPSMAVDFMVSFHTDTHTGKVNKVSVPLESSAPEVVFIRTN
ncbi:beta-lactamase/transpeptidase-like protein [Ramicandelaber brevisporus]|nr:beta-lactamase/transpeptidase-like protein [Ramicandelaber brevisporus]